MYKLGTWSVSCFDQSHDSLSKGILRNEGIVHLLWKLTIINQLIISADLTITFNQWLTSPFNYKNKG